MILGVVLHCQIVISTHFPYMALTLAIPPDNVAYIPVGGDGYRCILTAAYGKVLFTAINCSLYGLDDALLHWS